MSEPIRCASEGGRVDAHFQGVSASCGAANYTPNAHILSAQLVFSVCTGNSHLKDLALFPVCLQFFGEQFQQF